MKATEYFNWYQKKEKEVGSKEAIFTLVTMFTDEVEEIAKMRHAKSDAALLSILNEQNQKWNALRKFDQLFRRDGFINFMKKKMPFIKDAIEAGKD